MSGFLFVASPFSHDNEGIRARRYIDAARFCGWAWAERRLTVYSPVVHWREPARLCDLRTDHEPWIESNLAMLTASRGLVVLALDGWEDSAGVAVEIKAAQERGLPIEFYAPADDGEWRVYLPKKDAA